MTAGTTWSTAISSRPLDDVVVLITGGSGGIGAAAAEVFAAAGAAVAIAARSRAGLDKTAAALRRHSSEVLVVPTDVTRYDQVETLVDTVTEQLGGIDVLVNTAGTLGPIGVPLWESDPREWAATIESDVLGMVHTCHAVIPQMIDQGHGRVLNMSSPAAVTPIPRLGAYCVSKAAVVQLTRVLAGELDGTDVTVHSFNVGPTDSPVYHQVRRALFPDLPVSGRASEPVPAQEVHDACEMLVLAGIDQVRFPNGSEISWNSPWVRRGVQRLRAGWLPRMSGLR